MDMRGSEDGNGEGGDSFAQQNNQQADSTINALRRRCVCVMVPGRAGEGRAYDHSAGGVCVRLVYEALISATTATEDDEQ